MSFRICLLLGGINFPTPCIEKIILVSLIIQLKKEGKGTFINVAQ
jgi:hypothetical protein